MMTRINLLGTALALWAGVAAMARAQVTQEEIDGVMYQVQTVPRVINETRYEPRKYTAYRDRYTTDMQQVNRSYQVPVTEQQWVPGYQRTWNIFAPPVLSYRLLPVTRWETRTESVRVPVTKRESIPEEQVQQVPITTQRLVQEIHKYPIGGVRQPGNTALVGSGAPAGGTKLESDPPRGGTAQWQGSGGSTR